MDANDDTVLVSGEGRLSRMARSVWEGHLAAAPEAGRKRLAFMSAEHHRVRELVVRELPRSGAMSAETIAATLALPLPRVRTIVEELERRLFFLVRNADGAVSWAFPVTADPTPHRLAFSSGERCFAA